MLKPADIRAAGQEMGRAELAERALAIAQDMVNDGSYKRAIEGAGQLKVIAQACAYDEYWREKTHIGEYREQDELEKVFNRQRKGQCNGARSK